MQGHSCMCLLLLMRCISVSTAVTNLVQPFASSILGDSEPRGDSESFDGWFAAQEYLNRMTAVIKRTFKVSELNGTVRVREANRATTPYAVCNDSVHTQSSTHSFSSTFGLPHAG
eukprot:138504-Pyramimonas_sp.AAC.1